MTVERIDTEPFGEQLFEPDYALAGSLQATINNLQKRGYKLDISQAEAIDAIGHALLAGTPSGYIEMPTGTGKTAIAALVAEAGVRAGRRVLMLAPSHTIADQLVGNDPNKPTGLTKFAHLPDGAKISCQYGHRKAHKGSDVVVATYQSLLGDAKSDLPRLGDFDIVIADECHRSLGPQTSHLLRQMYPDSFKLGLSATPDYAVDRRSVEVYDRKLYEYSLLEAVDAGKTAPVRALIYETGSTISAIDNVAEFTDRELAPLIHDLERNGTAIELAKAFVAEGRQGIVSCIAGQTNMHARQMADLLKKQGIRSVEIGAHLDNETRERRLKSFEAGHIDVLTFTRALEEGWDSLVASFAINMAPTNSPVRTTQMLGRILRKKPDRRDSVYIDFIDMKRGIPKSQYTAMHALGLERIDLDRILGNNTNPGNEWRLFHQQKVLSPDIYKRILASHGKLLREVSVGRQIDPLVLEWEAKLTEQGLPAELGPNNALPARLARRAEKAYTEFLHENGEAPTSQELTDRLGKLAKFEQRLLGSYALQAPYDKSVRKSQIRRETGDNPYVEATEIILQEQITAVLDTLSDREAGTLAMYFGLDQGHDLYADRQVKKLIETAIKTHGIGEKGTISMDPSNLDTLPTLNEIGEVYGLQKERVRQIVSKTLSKVRNPSRSEVLRGYLESSTDNESTYPDVREDYSTPQNGIDRNSSASLREYLDEDKFVYTPPPLLRISPSSEESWDSKPSTWQSHIATRLKYGIEEHTPSAYASARLKYARILSLSNLRAQNLRKQPLSHASRQRGDRIRHYESKVMLCRIILNQIDDLREMP